MYKLSKYIIPSLLMIMILSCDRNKEYDISVPELMGHFQTATLDLQVGNDNVVTAIPVGLTAVSNEDQTFTISVGRNVFDAVEGVHYEIPNKTVVIPAGSVLSSFNFVHISDLSYFEDERVDTIELVLVNTKSGSPDFGGSIELRLGSLCEETSIRTLAPLAGTHPCSENSSTYGGSTYNVTISNVVEVSPGIGTVSISNLWATFNAITVVLNYEDNDNRTATIPETYTGFTVSGNPLYMRSVAGTESYFSVCDKSILMTLELVFDPGSGIVVFDTFTVRINM